MKLQLALDEMPLVDALRFADKVAEHVDIIEIGTPFVMDEGMRGVREFHRFFPDKEILADLKIMDGGYLEASYAYALKPEIIIVGSAIGHADDPVAEAKAIKDAML